MRAKSAEKRKGKRPLLSTVMGYNEMDYNDAAISRDGGGFTDRAFQRYLRHTAGGCVVGLRSRGEYAAKTERQKQKAVPDRYSGLLLFPTGSRCRAASWSTGASLGRFVRTRTSHDIRASTPSRWRGRRGLQEPRSVRRRQACGHDHEHRPPAPLGRNVRSLDPRGAPLAEELKATSPEAHPAGT